jgi:hypothetical protein
MDVTLTVPHIHEFIKLWVQLDGIHLHEDNNDAIVWNPTSNDVYSSALTYNAQFFRATLTSFNELGWKAGEPPEVNLSA